MNCHPERPEPLASRSCWLWWRSGDLHFTLNCKSFPFGFAQGRDDKAWRIESWKLLLPTFCSTFLVHEPLAQVTDTSGCDTCY
jgi:hypothetical protein